MSSYDWFSFILGLPKTIYLNFKYFKFRDAIKLPILVSHNVCFQKLKGKININGPIKSKMIIIGFDDVGIFDKRRAKTLFNLSGTITFNGRATFVHGARISVSGDLVIGDNLVFSSASSIICVKKIVIGDDCNISWENLLMDTDFHKIKDSTGKIINSDREIVIGDKVWIGCRCMVLKGATIGNEVVVAAGNCVRGKITGSNQIIGGNSVTVLKENISWEE